MIDDLFPVLPALLLEAFVSFLFYKDERVYVILEFFS